MSKQKVAQKKKENKFKNNLVINFEEKDLKFQNWLIVIINIYNILIISRKRFTAGSTKNYSILINYHM